MAINEIATTPQMIPMVTEKPPTEEFDVPEASTYADVVVSGVDVVDGVVICGRATE